MLTLPLLSDPSLRRVLCLGAHCDDVEIGMGATLAQLCAARPELEIAVCVLTGNDVRSAETTSALEEMMAGHAPHKIDIQNFRNGHFPWHATDIKAHIETYKEFDPQLVFTHYRQDHHQDHRTVSELTANTFRDHLVLEYEILKYDPDLGNPNVFVPVTREQLDAKIDILMRSFPSQADKQWFTADVFSSMARIRGVHSASPTGFAEAFYANKISLSM
ncbi:MAG: PIG-L deacetylase family protein [Gammaproteobacteria bacterium]